MRYNRLLVSVESGVGNQVSPGDNPKIELRTSRDGARTWSDWTTSPIGKVGEYANKAVFRRLGVAEQMTFAVRITDPVKRVIVGAYLS